MYKTYNDTISAEELRNLTYETSTQLPNLEGKVLSGGMLNVNNMYLDNRNITEISRTDTRKETNIPQYVLDLLNEDVYYSELNDGQKELLFIYLQLREDTMSAAEQAGHKIGPSVHYAKIMQILNISMDQAQRMVQNHGGVNEAYLEVMKLEYYQRQYLFLNGPQQDILSKYLIDGIKTSDIVNAATVADALQVDVKELAALNQTDITDADLTMYSREEQALLIDLVNAYHLKLGWVSKYILDHNITPIILENTIDAHKRRINFYRNNLFSPLSDIPSGLTLTKEHPSAAFTYEMNSNEDINLNTGVLTYKESIASLAGRNGLDLNLSISYHSDQATNLNKAYSKEKIVTYKAEANLYRVICWGDAMLFDIRTSPYTYYGYAPAAYDVKPFAVDSYRTLYEAENAGRAWNQGGGYWNDPNIVSDTRYFPNPNNKYWYPGNPNLLLMMSSFYEVEKYYGEYEDWNFEYTNELDENNVITENPLQYMGEGWSLDFNRIDINEISNEKYLKLVGGSSYKMLGTGEYSLENYGLADIRLRDDSSSFPGSKYVLEFNNGLREYFDGYGNIVARRDCYGNTILFSASGKNLYITDSLGQITTISGSETGYTITLPDQTTTGFKLSTKGEYTYLTEKTDPLGNATRFEYQSSKGRFDFLTRNFGKSSEATYHNLVSVAYPTGAATSYSYSKKTGNLGSIGAYEYFAVNNRSNNMGANQVRYEYSNENYTGYPSIVPTNYYTTVINQDGVSTTCYFDSRHLKTSIVEKDGNKVLKETNHSYNSYKLPTSIVTKTYGTSVVITQENYEYDIYGNVIGYWSPLAEGDTASLEHKTSYEFDPNFNIITKKLYKRDGDKSIKEIFTLTADKKSVADVSVYENDNLVSKEDYGYDIYGNLTEIKMYTDPITYMTTRNTYKDGAFLQSTETEGLVKNYTYDKIGRLLSESDFNGNITVFENDALGRTTKTVNPDGTYRKTKYDDQYNSVYETDENGISYTYKYNILGNLLSITNSTVGTKIAEYTYDNRMRVITEKDAKGTVTNYTYDYYDSVKKHEEWQKCVFAKSC